MFWVHAVCFYTLKFVSNAKQLFAAVDFSRRHFQGIFFLGVFRIKLQHSIYKHVFSAIVKISVDPDQVAFLEAS